MPRIVPNNFAIAFSLAGFGSLWLTAAEAGWAPRAVGEALFLVAAVVWAALVLAAVTLLVGAIAMRTVVALYRGTLFPRDVVPAPPVPTTTALPVSPSTGVR